MSLVDTKQFVETIRCVRKEEKKAIYMPKKNDR